MKRRELGRKKGRIGFGGFVADCLLPTADFFLVGGGLEAGQEVAGFWGLGLEVGFYVVDVDCGGWGGG